MKKGLTDLQKSVRPFSLDKFFSAPANRLQLAIKWGFEKSKSQCFQGFSGPHTHFLLTQTRSCQKFSKQICLWDLAQSIGILFIIQIVGAI